MRLTCLTKTIIKDYSNVRFMIITDDTVYSDDLLMSTYKTDDQFKIVGMPLKGVTDGYGYTKIEDTPESRITLNMLKNHIFEYDKLEKEMSEDPELDIWMLIQEKIFQEEIVSKGYKKRGIYQIALIDEDVYQMCLKQEKLSWYGSHLEDSKLKFKKEVDKLTKNVQCFSPSTLELIKKTEEKGEDSQELKDFFKESFFHSVLDEIEISFKTYFVSKTLATFAVNNLVDSLFESKYALSVLNENGYYLSPTNAVHMLAEQSDFTKILLNDQIADSFKEDAEEIVPIHNSEYVVSIDSLKSQIEDWFGVERMNELTSGLKLDDVINLNDNTDLADLCCDTLPAYVKQIKIVGE